VWKKLVLGTEDHSYKREKVINENSRAQEMTKKKKKRKKKKKKKKKKN